MDLENIQFNSEGDVEEHILAMKELPILKNLIDRTNAGEELTEEEKMYFIFLKQTYEEEYKNYGGK